MAPQQRTTRTTTMAMKRLIEDPSVVSESRALVGGTLSVKSEMADMFLRNDASLGGGRRRWSLGAHHLRIRVSRTCTGSWSTTDTS
ncbi:hypothetical protein TYRP_011270 [Tyrophagus putrescentiae]|nr:hypothetical protein TYRP_011270 [Tyrophagus putrescentiae]